MYLQSAVREGLRLMELRETAHGQEKCPFEGLDAPSQAALELPVRAAGEQRSRLVRRPVVRSERSASRGRTLAGV